MVDRMRTAILGVFADGVAADKAISVNDIRAIIIARLQLLLPGPKACIGFKVMVLSSIEMSSSVA